MLNHLLPAFKQFGLTNSQNSLKPFKRSKTFIKDVLYSHTFNSVFFSLVNYSNQESEVMHNRQLHKEMFNLLLSLSLLLVVTFTMIGKGF